MATGIVIQARTGSSRLPDKMLRPFYGDKGILEILLERICRDVAGSGYAVVVATSVAAGDDRIEALCRRLGVSCYRGSEDDVLSRFIGAADSHGLDRVVRVCADNVFLDTALLPELCDRLNSGDNDYESYISSDGTPSIRTHYGFWAEGVRVDALRRVQMLTTEKLYHEHVTNYVYGHPEVFRLNFRPIADTISGIESCKSLRLTIDTAEDFAVSREIYAHFADSAEPLTSDAIVGYVRQNPSYMARMQAVINQNKK